MADFDPRQLDLLEDALEDLEEIDDLESLELSPALTERLAEYRDVLALCRDAYPVEEPRVDLLADVLAEAHAVSRRPKLREAGAGGWRRFWERWRGTLIPGVALAGTAAAVLLLLEPQREDERRAELMAETQKADERERDEADTTPSEPASEPGVEEGAEEGADEAEPAEQIDEAGEELEIPEPVEIAKVSKKSKPRASKPAPAVEPEPTPEPMSKDETWTTLERGDGNRRKGDCERARARYQEVIAAGSDTHAVARAKAGIGLCLEQERKASEAEKWFSQARSDNAGIDVWIDEQRDEQPLPGEAKKAKKTDSL